LPAAAYGTGLAGRGVEAAGATAGAGAQAAGNIVGHIASSMGSERKRQQYGGTPLDALGGIMGDVGNVAGVGLTGLSGAVGSTLQDISRYMLMKQLGTAMLDRWGKGIDIVKGSNLRPHEAHLAGDMIRHREPQI
jgi:hypothetical protein